MTSKSFGTLEIASAAYSIAIRKFFALAGCVLAPAIAIGVMLYFLLSAYLLELEGLLQTGSDRMAGRVLGIVAAGLLLIALFHSILTISVAELALGRSDRPWFKLRLRLPEWREFGAMLRLLAVVLAWTIVVSVIAALAQSVVSTLASSVMFSVAVQFAILIGIFLIVVRMGILNPWLVLTEKGPVLRRAFGLTSHRTGQLCALMLILLFPGFACLAAAELIRYVWSAVPVGQSSVTLLSAVMQFRPMVPEFVAMFMPAYLVSAVLVSVGGVKAGEALSAMHTPQ
jgi:hypothetical protein